MKDAINRWGWNIEDVRKFVVRESGKDMSVEAFNEQFGLEEVYEDVV